MNINGSNGFDERTKINFVAQDYLSCIERVLET